MLPIYVVRHPANASRVGALVKEIAKLVIRADVQIITWQENRRFPRSLQSGMPHGPENALTQRIAEMYTQYKIALTSPASG